MPRCTSSSRAATPATRRWRQPPCCACASRCRPESAATCSRWSGDAGELTGLNSSGRAPQGADPESLEAVPERGPQTVTVPGAVAGWKALLERHGRLGLDTCLAAAIEHAEHGFAVTPVIARSWQGAEAALADDPEFRRELPASTGGRRRRTTSRASPRACGASPSRGRTRSTTARSRVRSAPRAGSRSRISPGTRRSGSQPLRRSYRDVTVAELPPNGQGAAALQAIGIYEGLPRPESELDRVHLQAEAMKLAFADALPLHRGRAAPRRATSPTATWRSGAP